MKRILIFTNNFLPGNRAGGPVTSIANLCNLLNNEYDIIIVTSNKDFGSNEPYSNVAWDKVVQYNTFNIIYHSAITINVIRETIKELNPNLIYLNSFFSNFTQMVLWLLFKNKITTPIVLAPRGELQENALAIKALKKKVYLFGYKLLKIYTKIQFHATDIIEYNRIKKIFGITSIVTIPNVPKITNVQPLNKQKDTLKLIFISRIRDNKNLLFALEALQSCQVNIIFDIYGPIEDETYWDTCQVSIKYLPINIKTNYKGIVPPTKIINIMRQYHALLLPTKTENFGHVIVEAMQAGLIPIISDQTPWIDLEHNKAGWSLDLNNVTNFTQAINTLYTMDSNTYTRLSTNTMKFISMKLNIEDLKQRYVKMFDTQITKRQSYKLKEINVHK